MVKVQAELTQTAAADAEVEVGFMGITEEQAETMAEAEVQEVLARVEVQVLGLFLRVAQEQAAAMDMLHYFIKKEKLNYGSNRKSH